MKKTLAVLLCLALVMTFAGCSGGQSQAEIDLEISDRLTGLNEDPGGALVVNSLKESLNPLTGQMNLANDRAGMRPYAVVIDNSDYNGKPQDGISRADILVEIETEAGISRVMALFSDTREIERIGPLRSLRDQFLELIFPLDPIVVHIGTSVFADKAINENAFRTLDGNNIRSMLWASPTGDRSSFAQTIFTSGSHIDSALASEGLKNESNSTVETFFNFASESEIIVPNDGAANTVKYNFSTSYDGDFRYDEQSGKYLKWQMGSKQVDEIYDDEQLAFTNVLLLYADIEVIAGTEEKGGLIEIDYQTGGTGYYFTQGNFEEITWTKGVYASNIKLFDSEGNELVMNAGNTHVGIIRESYSSKTTIA